MKRLDLTLATPAENLALDEALLEAAEAGEVPHEVLRFWESPQPFVVLGRSSRVEQEVDRAACRRRGLPILRRSSGGAAVVAGPGCLMYGLVLSHAEHPVCQTISGCHQLVMQRMCTALQPMLPEVAFRGTCDLALEDLKFSGNSLRVKRGHVLYHGTILYDFPLGTIADCLRTPPRQPDYRRARPHAAFVRNLPLPLSQLKAAIAAAWQADSELEDWPREQVRLLVEHKYSTVSWNFRR